MWGLHQSPDRFRSRKEKGKLTFTEPFLRRAIEVHTAVLSHLDKKPKLDDHPKELLGISLRGRPAAGADAMKQKQCEGAKRTGNTQNREKKRSHNTAPYRN